MAEAQPAIETLVPRKLRLFSWRKFMGAVEIQLMRHTQQKAAENRT